MCHTMLLILLRRKEGRKSYVFSLMVIQWKGEGVAEEGVAEAERVEVGRRMK